MAGSLWLANIDINGLWFLVIDGLTQPSVLAYWVCGLFTAAIVDWTTLCG